MKTNINRLLILVLLAGTWSACAKDPYHRAWYDVYGNHCGTGHPRAGCNFYADGSKIYDMQDPHADDADYRLGIWHYTDSYGSPQKYLGWAWQSPSGILYGGTGQALNDLQDTGSSADVIAQAAAQEQASAKAMGKAFAQRYALNEDKGIMISTTLQSWAQLGRDRSRTEADIADFASRLYGVDGTRAKNTLQQALREQSQKPLEDLNIDIAAHWGTSPEVSQRILKNWYKEELEDYGVR